MFENKIYDVEFGTNLEAIIDMNAIKCDSDIYAVGMEWHAFKLFIFK